ncbi:DEAD/DEAH box helicase [Ruminococcus difficilis]|uniref:DEAD/DEAH box helicase family protein n=1 Tax=Ruminococcus difficilis TaxID=2763069 RepID=A0A934WTL5_9FIRM|nr:DEAD/DEAH box helicase family protein [Ruminococcus difficilis]MBK6089661.1 DEAD/DEAH box helicase family protein [Ruminococcus difficilis]
MPLRPYQNDLVEDVRSAWHEGYRAPCIVLGCGGGKSCIVAEIARRTTFNGKRVLFLVHRKELVDQITATFARWGVLMDLCFVGMVQTITRRLKKIPKPALIITDENHHSLATSYKRIYEHFSDVPRVGVTATPVRLNGDGLGDVNDKLIIGKSTKWLIANGFLAPYDYYAPSVADLTGLHTRRGEYVQSDIDKAMIQNKVFGDVIAYYRKLANEKKAICYCASIKHSKATAAAFCDAGIRAKHIDGDTPKNERDRIISAFRKGEITILCNVDLISEGFDVPDCECSILLRPTHSLTLYIQQSMRCMRYRKDKRAIIIDHVGNYARHGMPDDDREWTLAKKEHKRIQTEKENSESVVMCPECFFTFARENAENGCCPHCGAPLPKRTRKLTSDEDAELIRIEGFKLDFDTPDDCHTYDELLSYAKRRGYKPGWAYYQARLRGMIA